MRQLLSIFSIFKFKFYYYYNRALFRLYKIRIGKNATIVNKVYLKIAPGASIDIGNNFTFTSGDALNALSRNIRGCLYAPFPTSHIKIGDNVGLSSVCIWAKESVTIGNNVQIGSDCIIIDTDAHNLDYSKRAGHDMLNPDGVSVDHLTAKSKPIVIEDDVMIGVRCIILKGVTIGARSVIGAGSVVTSSIPADSIAAGNPCRVIRKLES